MSYKLYGTIHDYKKSINFNPPKKPIVKKVVVPKFHNEVVKLHKEIKKEFLKLPEPYRTQAINNLSIKYINDNYDWIDFKNLKNSSKKIKDYLNLAFPWYFAKEGREHWEKLYDSII